jgi:hypothetical protein
VVLRQDAALGTISTVVLRGSTEGFLDDVERAVNDGVNAYKVGRVGHRALGYWDMVADLLPLLLLLLDGICESGSLQLLGSHVAGP